MSETQPPTDFIPPTPAQLLLERILGALQAQMIVLAGPDHHGRHAKVVRLNELLQDEIIQLDAGTIPESIREAYEALQEHALDDEPMVVDYRPPDTMNVLYTFDETMLAKLQAGEPDHITMTVGVQPVRIRIEFQPIEETECSTD